MGFSSEWGKMTFLEAQKRLFIQKMTIYKQKLAYLNPQPPGVDKSR